MILNFQNRKQPDHQLGWARISPILICIFLVVITSVAYWQLPDSAFTNYDDNNYVTENRNIKSGLTFTNVSWAFTKSHSANWHPMTWLSHMLDIEIYGLNPSGHHVTNLLFHLANSLLLFALLHRITGRFWQSSFVAVMFALHPLNVESVAWVSQRKTVLSTFFALLTIGAYIHYIEKRKVANYLFVVLFFVLGLMSKPMLVTLPFILLLLDYWPLCRIKLNQRPALAHQSEISDQTFRSLIWEKIPLFFLALISSVITFQAQKGGGAVFSLETYPMQVRFANAMVSYLEYLEKMMWPKGLSVLYPHPGNTLGIWKGWVCAAVLACLTYSVIRAIRQAPYLAVGWFWYLGTLIPVIGFVQVGVQALADRYMYVPLIGIFIAIGWGVPELLKKLPYRNLILSVASGFLIPTLMVLTWQQVSHWKDSISLFKHAIEVYDKTQKPPPFALTHNNLGAALHANNYLEQAEDSYNSALDIKPDYVNAHNGLGNVLLDMGKTKEAIEQYKIVIKLHPGFAIGHNNLGAAMKIEGDLDQAISLYNIALKLKPDFVDAHSNLAEALFAKGNPNQAAIHYEKILEYNSEHLGAHTGLGNIHILSGSSNKAIKHYQKILSTRPDDAIIHNNLGSAFYNKKDIEKAIGYYKKALQLKPNYADAHFNLGTALSVIGKVKEAAHHFKKAKDIKGS